MSKEAALNIASQIVTPQVVPPEVPAADVIDSRRMAIFAKREAQMQKEREAFKADQEKLKQEKEQVNGVQRRAKEFDDLKAKDPIAALKLLGFSEADIFNFMAGQEKKEPTTEETARKIAQEEMQKVRDDLAKEKKDNEEKSNAERITSFKSDISETLKQKAEEYKFCAFRGPEAEEQVFEYISENLRENKIMLTPDEALKDIEELYRLEYEAMTSFNKPKEEPKAEVPIEPTVPVRTQASKTLTNKISQTASAVANAVPKKETREEKRARLEQALRQGYI